jgi:nucleoid-associated protein YgaU
MSTYTKIRFLLGLAAIFVFVYVLDGLPCLGDANEVNGGTGTFPIFRNYSNVPKPSQQISLEQSLVVPKLIASEFDKIDIYGIFPSSMFEKVESIGRRHLSTKAKGVQYVVKEGDSLWSIAAERLGKGSRYDEISKLNADVLKNDHDLTIGMRLSLPNS